MTSKRQEQDQDAEEIVPNLPSLAPGWCWTTLRDISEIAGGITKDQKRPVTASMREVPYLRVANVQRGYFDLQEIKTILADEEEIEDLRLKKGDILFTEGGDRDKLGRGWVWNDDITECIHQNHIFRARPRLALVHPKFVSYHGNFFGQHWFTRTGKQTTNLASINKGVLSRFPVPLAPINEQIRIVAKIEELFSDLDAGVASLLRVRANLKRYRAAVFKAAVEGKLTEEWRTQHPDTEPASVLLDRILIERRRRWENEQLAKFSQAGRKPPKGWQERYKATSGSVTYQDEKLPVGWCMAKLGQVASFQNGHAFPSREYQDEGVKLLRPGNLFEDGSVRWDDKNTRRLPVVWSDMHPLYIIGHDELIMNLTAQSLKDEFLGRICLTSHEEQCLLNQRLARITPVEPLGSKFTLYLLKSKLFRIYVNDLNTGSLIQHMFTSQLDSFGFPLPPLDEQYAIVDEIEHRLSVVEKIEGQVQANLTRAARLRQGILKRAFEGRLVPQDPKDEPAEHLLARIRHQRQPTAPAINVSRHSRQRGRSRKGEASLPLFAHDDDGDDQGGEP